jgi:hypothetical protein
MNFPKPGMKVFIEEDGQIVEYLNPNGKIETIKSRIEAVTNQEYEIRENNKKRFINVIRKEFAGLFVRDMKDMMHYKTSSQKVNKKTKRAYNERTGN